MSTVDLRDFSLVSAAEGAFWAAPSLPLDRSSARRLALAQERPVTPVAFAYGGGRRAPADLVAGGFAALLLLSPDATRALAEAGCSGWETFPADVRGASGEKVPGYAGLAVSGRSGPVDPSRGKRRRGGHGEFRGLFFDERTWDGSDLFCPEGSTFVVASPRASEAMRRARLRGVELEPLPRVELADSMFGR